MCVNASGGFNVNATGGYVWIQQAVMYEYNKWFKKMNATVGYVYRQQVV